MSKNKDGNERLLDGLNVPGPPEELRAPSLARAKRALADGPRPDLWAQIWNSREARLAWVASVLVLGLCHVVLPLGDGGPTGDTVHPRAAGQPNDAGQPSDADSSPGRSTTFWTAPGDYGELSVIIDLPRLIFDDRTLAASAPVSREVENEMDDAVPPAEPEENAS